MKTVLRVLTLVISVCLLLSLIGCADVSLFPSVGGGVEGGENNGGNNTENGGDNAGNSQNKPDDDDPDHKKGEFTVKFYLGAKAVTHRYDYGETVEPPHNDGSLQDQALQLCL